MGSSQDSLLTRNRFKSFFVICFMILLNGASEGLAQERIRDSRTLAHWLGYQQSVFEDDSLNTERPTFTPNSTSLGRKVFQVETGYLYTRQAAAGSPSVVSHQLPETQLRWGLFADWFEFRISQAFLSQEEPSTRLTGASDTQIGCLIALTKQQDYVPECAWIPFVSVPSGSSWASDGATRGGAALSYSWGFGENWTLGASTQLNSEIDNSDSSSYLSTYQSCYLKRGISDKTSVYGEWYAGFPYRSTSEISEHFINTGMLVLFRDNLQWDARIGTGLLEGESNVFAGTGLSIRFH